MDSSKIAKQMIDFQKTTFDNTFNAMAMLQEQAESMSRTILDQATWMPEEGRKAVNDWLKAYKKGREDFKKGVNENFTKVEDFFNTFDKGTKTKK
jgi:polyhydroxyalkanoate synthesis regulator phasin